MTDENIYVTQPYLPSLSDYASKLAEIWDAKWLTNNGNQAQALEAGLRNYLAVEHLSLMCNGTIALITALKALELSGDVITTPYTFVATTNALDWCGLNPVFVDIDPETLNIDASLIEAAITPDTTAILAVHCYGVPCDVVAIEAIAEKHGLKVIYDAAHAFGVTVNGRSLLSYGDASAVSFHATKVFSTVEGGAVIAKSPNVKRRVELIRNFGIESEFEICLAGGNGKMSELHAAYGLCQLEVIEHLISSRAAVSTLYSRMLDGGIGLDIHMAKQVGVKKNFAYFPVLINNDYPFGRDELYSKLKAVGVHTRKYFYPLIANLPMHTSNATAHKSKLPVANDVAGRILCLPIYPGLTEDDVERIASAISDWSSS